MSMVYAKEVRVADEKSREKRPVVRREAWCFSMYNILPTAECPGGYFGDFGGVLD